MGEKLTQEEINALIGGNSPPTDDYSPDPENPTDPKGNGSQSSNIAPTDDNSPAPENPSDLDGNGSQSSAPSDDNSPNPENPSDLDGNGSQSSNNAPTDDNSPAPENPSDLDGNGSQSSAPSDDNSPNPENPSDLDGNGSQSSNNAPTDDNSPAPENQPAPKGNNSQSSNSAPTDDNSPESYEEIDLLTTEQKDILGEVGNISMGTSATTLSTLLNNKVLINAPEVSVMKWKMLPRGYSRPCVGVKVDYKEGLIGSNILILKQHDVKIITNLMMGGDGNVTDSEELTEIDLSAIGEAMNQMVGSASTSLSSMIKIKIDIDTPQAFILDFNDDQFFDKIGFSPDDVISCIKFRMEIGDLIDSEIMQILSKDFALNLVESLKNDLMSEAAPAPLKTPEPTAKATAIAAQSPSPNPTNTPKPKQAPPPQTNVNVAPVQFQSFDSTSVLQQRENIEIIMDVPLEVTVELGRTRKKIKEILEFSPGTIIELDKLAGEPIDILANGKFVAKGEVVVIDENFGIRVTDIISLENRI